MNLKNITKSKPLILASESQQRANILKMLKVPFIVVPSGIDEVLTDNHNSYSPAEIAEFFSLQKAQVVSKKFPNNVILAVDTLVVSEKGEILGKPKNQQEAKKMILGKSDSKEEIISGITIIANGKVLTKHEKSYVYFAEISESDAEDILKFNEWQGRSGAFSVEGKTNLYIKKIEGDFYNIVGLPVYLLGKMLKKFI